MAVDPLVQSFIDKYHRQKAADPGGDPVLAPEDILEIEDSISDVLCLIDVLNLAEEEREELRGQRAAEMADLVAETAEGLREFPGVAASLGITPESLEGISAQDLALGGIIQSLQTTYRRTDTGMLQASERGGALLQEAEEQIAAALPRIASSSRREAFEARFGEVLGHRRRLEGVAASIQPPQEEQLLKDARDQQTLDEIIRDFVNAAVIDRDKGKDRPRRSLAEEINDKGIVKGQKAKKGKE